MKAVTMVFTVALLAIGSLAEAGLPTGPVVQVPEPSSLLLLGSGLATWLWTRLR